MLTAAAICFLLHALVAVADGAYFHLYKYALHTRPQSIVEHFTHTLRAATMTAAAFVFFVVNARGWLLWLGVGIIGVDLVVETWDVWIERDSRADLGGLSSAEYLCHAHAILLYAAAYTLVLAHKPAASFHLTASAAGPAHPAFVRLVGWLVGVGSAIGTVQHVVYLHPRFRADPGPAERATPP